MDISLIFSGLAAFGYTIAAIFSKQALAEGCGVLRLSFVINLVFIAVFAVLLVDASSEPIPWRLIHLPILTGLLFFLGQVFTFSAIRMGDVSLQTPIMGTKVVFVVLIALWLGTEQVTLQLILAAVLSMIAIALLGFSGGGAKRVGLTLVLALSSSLFFAGSDTMVGAYGSVFGLPKFLFIAILVNGLLSFLMIPFFKGSLLQITPKAWPWVLLAAFGMGLQALLLNYTLARYQNVSAINVIYSSRGLWSVFFAIPVAILLSLPRERLTARMLWQRGIGALLLCVAIATVFS
jgi:drug/metabolite transporter (DMT)-like permease